MSDRDNPKWESPSGLDLNPRPPKAVRVSKRAAGVVIAVGASVLLLFAYGGYQRQREQVAELGAADTKKKVAPAVAAGADIVRDIPAGNLLIAPTVSPSGLRKFPPANQVQAPENSGPGGGDRVIVRRPPPARPVAPPAQVPKDLSPDERRKAAAYEREQQAIAAPTTVRSSFGSSRPPPVAPYPPSENSAAMQLPQLPGALATPTRNREPITAETIRSLIGSPGGGSSSQDSDAQTQQVRKEEFIAKARVAPISDYLKSTRDPAISPYEIKAGWEIPAILEQSVNSDLPGEVKALVTSNVYDTATGQHLLIPQGSRLVGLYSSQIGYGQEGVQVIWHRVIFPDASSLDLGGMVGQDSRGQSGLRHQVDRHYKRLISFTVLTSLFAAASDLATSRSRTLLAYPSRGEIFGSAVGREATELGAQVTRRNLNVQPTIKVPVGYKFNVRVNRDILFEAPFNADFDGFGR